MDKFQRFEYTSNIDNTNDWYVYRHSGDNKDCVVVLHGHGSHGDQLLTWKSTRAFWEKFLPEEKVNVFSPNLRDNAWMCPNAVDDLAMLLTENKARYHWKRIILASGSMGASGSLVFAMRHPELVDGVVALGAATDIKSYREWCAVHPLSVHKSIHDAIVEHYTTEADYAINSVVDHAEKLTMPIWFSHGEADATIPVSQARALVEKLSGKKDFYYREIPGGDHDSPIAFREESMRAMLHFLDNGVWE